MATVTIECILLHGFAVDQYCRILVSVERFGNRNSSVVSLIQMFKMLGHRCIVRFGGTFSLRIQYFLGVRISQALMQKS